MDNSDSLENKMEPIKKNLGILKKDNDKIKYLEEQIKKTKDKKIIAMIEKILKGIKKPHFEEKILPKKEPKEELIAKKKLSEEILELAVPKYETRVTLESAARTSSPSRKTQEKSYESQASYGIRFSDYKAELSPSLYSAGTKSFKDLEDNLIKEGILTPGRFPTEDQIDVMREKLRKINPGVSEESMIFYEKKIISDIKERKDLYSSKVR